MYDQMPWQVAVPLIIILWTLFLAVKFHWLQHFQDWAAQRRHMRRVRNRRSEEGHQHMREYARQDVAATMAMYHAHKGYSGRHIKKRGEK